ncbi:hypothetical protein BV25DRAFT_323575 [Artomyces pyxidatus]|uniref:Uncharacterized protein n=1 Tax=Artomyces pyxidatus TaxID=48021 RepID=A0ACB8SGB8_9AGAM|nr:hypothetical protein BV25DRAFT_323575 [Artomyces pyxidatus]
MCGFADNRHNEDPCPKCGAKRATLYEDGSLSGEFEPRDGQQHKERAVKWLSLETDEERADYFKKYGVRWTEFARLPYFDPNNSLRTTTEAGNKRELDMVHKCLKSLEVPAWVGRLPSRVGEPAGGSLGADEYKMLITTVGAMILPLVWDEFEPEASDEYKKARLKWKPIKMILAYSTDEESLARAESLLFDYLLLYKKIHGVDAMKPNHHFCRHIIDQIRDYGPVPVFWAFLGERLNKVLKGFKLNNWGGGQLETTMMRALERDVHLHGIISEVASGSSKKATTLIAQHLLEDPVEARGTVEVLAQDPGVTDEVLDDALSALHIQLGPPARAPEKLSDSSRAALYQRYNSEKQRVYYNTDTRRPATGVFLNNRAQFYSYVLVDGRRITPVHEAKAQRPSAAIVKVMINGNMYGGVVMRVFQHEQKGLRAGEESTIYAEMKWMKRQMLSPVVDDPWKDFPKLEVEFWSLDTYLDDQSPDSPPAVIPISAIRCQLARCVCRTVRPPLWITTSLERHAMSMGIDDNESEESEESEES